MQLVKPIKEPKPHHVHVIEGTWATKAIRIDTQRLSLVMVKEGMRSDGLYDDEGFAEVQTFAWGADAPRQTLRVLAFAYSECTVPQTWIRSLNSHMALEEFFIERLCQLPAADFSLRYTDKELHHAMQCIQCMWNKKAKALE